MKKHSAETLFKPSDPQPSHIPAKAHVRYVGFEGNKGGRRLGFFVKSIGHEWVQITIEISDAAFAAASGISIQDAAPMRLGPGLYTLAGGERPAGNRVRRSIAECPPLA